MLVTEGIHTGRSGQAWFSKLRVQQISSQQAKGPRQSGTVRGLWPQGGDRHKGNLQAVMSRYHTSPSRARCHLYPDTQCNCTEESPHETRGSRPQELTRSTMGTADISTDPGTQGTQCETTMVDAFRDLMSSCSSQFLKGWGPISICTHNFTSDRLDVQWHNPKPVPTRGPS